MPLFLSFGRGIDNKMPHCWFLKNHGKILNAALNEYFN